MLKITPKKRVLFVRRAAPVVLALFGVFSLFAAPHTTSKAYASAVYNETVNFQARLQTSVGAVVPDGTYNIQFKLYDASTGGTALWTETYLNSNSNGLSTVNGYFSTGLGSVTSFPYDMKWSHNLWLTMNIGGIGSTPSWDGEMNPRMQLTAIPYAFQANRLVTGNDEGTYQSSLAIQAPTGGNQNFLIQDQGAQGTYNLLTVNQADANYIALQGPSPTVQTGNLKITGSGDFATGIVTGGNIKAAGALELTGSGTSNYISPNGVSVPSKINIANFNPGAYGQVVALGLNKNVDLSARVLTVMDAREDVHQPSIALLSPNEQQIFGLSWDGSNTVARVKTSSPKIAISAGGKDVITAQNELGLSVLNIGAPNDSTGMIKFWSGTTDKSVILKATNASGEYAIDLPSGLGTVGQCMSISGVSGLTETMGYKNCASTLQDAYVNAGSNPTISLNSTGKGLSIQDASTSVGGNLFSVQDANASNTYFAVTTSGVNVKGTMNVDGTVKATTSLADSLGIGTLSPTRSLDVAVNNSSINALPVIVRQAGTGDSGIEIANSTKSYYVGLDTTDGTFKINSSTNAGGTDNFNNALFQLAENGDAQFRSMVNSSSAFTVQNASGTSAFIVNTSDNKVVVGPAAGSVNPTLLVVGKKTDAGDPGSVVNGAMYYNAAMGSFRCGQADVWVSCVGGLLTASTAINSTVSNTTTETTFGTTYAIPASYCANNRVLRVTANGLYSTAASTTSMAMRVKLNSTAIGVSDQSSNLAANLSNKGWNMSFTVMCPNAASSNATVTTQGLLTTHTDTRQIAYTSTGGIDTSGALTLGISTQWGTADPSNSITLNSLTIEGLGP